jgi:hypothetical protein
MWMRKENTIMENFSILEVVMKFGRLTLWLVLLLVLVGCDKTDNPDPESTSPVLYYNDTRVRDGDVIELDPQDDSFDLRDLFTVVDEPPLSGLDLQISSYDASVPGDTEITLTITDGDGNETNLTILLRIRDILAPVIHRLDGSLIVGSTIDDLEAILEVSDDVGIDQVLIDDSLVQYDIPGEYAVLLDIRDAAGNRTTDTFLLTILPEPFVPVDPEEDLDDGVIYYILESSIPPYYDYHIAAKAIQGIVNRNQPNLMIVDLNNPFYTHTDLVWKSYIEDIGYTFVELNSFLDILITFEHYFSDIIAINDDFKSYNGWVASDADFGAMLAGITHYMPVPEGSLAAAEAALDIQLIESFTLNDVLLSGYISDNFRQYDVANAQQGYGFVFDRFKELFAQDRFMGLTSEAMDYAVQQGMLFVDLKPTYQDYDADLYTEIAEWFDTNNDLFRLYGWVDQEGSGLDFIGRYGGLIHPIGTQNLSLYHVIEVDDTFEQASEFVLDGYDPSKTYVTFLASEGDTFKAPMTFQQGSWLDPYRGMVPINWGVIASTVYEFPIIAKYMYDTMTPNDYFFSGGSSSLGFVDVDTQMPAEALAELVEWNRLLLDLSDQAYVDTYNDLFMYGDTFDPNVTSDYLIASGYKGAYGIHPWEATGPIYMGDMFYYNRKNVFYPRRGSSSYVSLTNMTRIDETQYVQSTTSDYWYLQSDLVRTTSDQAVVNFFTQTNGDGYRLRIGDGQLILERVVGATITELGRSSRSSIGSHELIVSVDRSSSLLESTRITVYFDQDRIFHLEDNAFTEGGFSFLSDAGVPTTFRNVKGQHLSQAEEIYYKILNDPNQFVVGYYGVMFDHDFPLSQYHTEPGPGEVVSLSPTDVYKIALLLEENHPEEYVIVNMDEFYTYLLEAEQE